MQDPFARGSYSYVPYNVNAPKLRRDLAEPLQGLFFAGEALDPLDNQTVHGAVASGCLAAEEVKQYSASLSLQQNNVQTNEGNFKMANLPLANEWSGPE